jgi:HAD superfamily hydrolase (TIGR01509 family)
MIYWIFDMDDTLYQRDGNSFSYNMLKRDNELIYLLKKLEGIKILLTNGTHLHTNLVLDKMDLTSVFDLILDRNILGAMKPDPIVFYKVQKWCSIDLNDTCIFFEDSLANLVASSNFGWTLVHINPNNNIAKNVEIKFNITYYDGKVHQTSANLNFTFKNIKSALRHFINKTV